MKAEKNLRKVLGWINNYLIFFVTVGFVISCCTMLFVSTLANTLGITLTGENLNKAAKLTLLNVMLLSLIFAS